MIFGREAGMEALRENRRKMEMKGTKRNFLIRDAD
jgi:hypothetical protein